MLCSLRQNKWITAVSILLTTLTFVYVGGRLEYHSATATGSHKTSVKHLQEHRLSDASLLLPVTDGEASDKTADLFSGHFQNLSTVLLDYGFMVAAREALAGHYTEPAAGTLDGVTQALQTVILLD